MAAGTVSRQPAASPGRLGAGEFCGEVVRRRREPALVLTELLHRRPWRLPAHSHAAAGVCLLLRGSYREWAGSLQLELRPGDVVYHPADYSHRDEVGPHGAHFFFVELTGVFGSRLEEALPRGPVLDRGGAAAALARRLRRELAADDPAAALIREGLACELAGVLLRRRRDEGAAAWLRRADALLRERLDHRWSLAELAAAAGVSSVRLSRGFRRAFGESVGERLRRLRLEAARELLASPASDLAEVAFTCGFADQSHMTRAFRAAYGTTPGRLRAGSASG